MYTKASQQHRHHRGEEKTGERAQEKPKETRAEIGAERAKRRGGSGAEKKKSPSLSLDIGLQSTEDTYREYDSSTYGDDGPVYPKGSRTHAFAIPPASRPALLRILGRA